MGSPVKQHRPAVQRYCRRYLFLAFPDDSLGSTCTLRRGEYGAVVNCYSKDNNSWSLPNCGTTSVVTDKTEDFMKVGSPHIQQ